jgi:NADH-quinone oxidoreductase subunit N
MSFKVSAAPFHFWTPDVYDGAQQFSFFMATIVKAAAFIAFIRLFDEAFGTSTTHGNYGLQYYSRYIVYRKYHCRISTECKRMLAYSSIAQAGFMMLALFAMNTDAKEVYYYMRLLIVWLLSAFFAVLAKMNDYTFDGFQRVCKTDRN